MTEATARRKRQAAADKMKLFAKHVTALVTRNEAPSTRPSTMTMERMVAALYKAWEEVEAISNTLRVISDEAQREADNTVYEAICRNMNIPKKRSKN